MTRKGKDYHEKQSELFQEADEKAKSDPKAKDALSIVQEMLVGLDEGVTDLKNMDEAAAHLANIVFGTSVEDKLHSDTMDRNNTANRPDDGVQSVFPTDPHERTKQSKQ